MPHPLSSYPRAILHIDGDAFFASCEQAKDPSLRGKPVVTGKERGIVSAASYEAKALGVTRATPLHEVKKNFPQVIILSSDYESYSLYSHRMYAITRRYTPQVEEYGIDECFADITGMRRVHGMTYPEIARKIKEELQSELHMTFSLGLSATKVLAKIGSKMDKPDGLTCIPLREATQALSKIPVGRVWGIGPNTAAYLNRFGIRTAGDFANRSEAWVHEHLSKPGIELWQELNGEFTLELAIDAKESYQSISKTKTFTPPSVDSAFLYAQLSKNIENACIKARRYSLATPCVFFFLKSQDFRYHGFEIKLPFPTANPQDILREVALYFPKVFEKGKKYRATGITLMKLQEADPTQLDLFGAVGKSEGLKRVFENVDALAERYGKHVVFLGSSFGAITKSSGSLYSRVTREGEVPELSQRAAPENLFKGETARKRLSVPLLGEVS